jgi:hypothetical protein
MTRVKLISTGRVAQFLQELIEGLFYLVPVEVASFIVEGRQVETLVCFQSLALGVTVGLRLDHVPGLVLDGRVQITAEPDFLVLFE